MDIYVVNNEKQQQDAFDVRYEVFVNEQNVPEEEEIDRYEEEAIHFVGYTNDRAIAASRMRLINSYAKLERICILKDHRGNGYGKDLLLFMEETAKQKGASTSKLHAQTQAEEFYQSLGYEKTSSDVFMDAGIPHVTMTKSL
ncbi:GNAT family acetyltransferase [Gracilibacillus halophilus YIM-C55.5]|uniref:GNAT family acetyltransferase n=1 Tax=Gracilibacillus halophilus YIM-C55.5 TaxID=1308866 RepID=N4WIA9_9BACI|nr:GNAT family N-acetyltransferase [Gracilibacillus halophilus]ENH95912.1 GNAT family acetyltransferase [Gracilibacillus halophilus YIM-C55.5]